MTYSEADYVALGSVRSGRGGWRRFEDFCNSGERGSHLSFTSGAVDVEEELLGVELGWRVVDYIMDKAITGWDALLDVMYRSDMEREARELHELPDRIFPGGEDEEW